MKRFATLTGCLIALTVSTAWACPIKKGFIANGVVKDIVHMQPLCEMNSSMKSLVPTAKWVEVWGTSNDKKGALNVAYLFAALKEQGYKEVAAQKTAKGMVWRYDKGSKSITILSAINDPLVFLAIAGK